MRPLFMKMSISLDGFVATESGDNSWVFTSSDESSKAWSVKAGDDASMIIMGRKSFQAMAPYWPGADSPFAQAMNGLPKAVFTLQGYDPATAIPDNIKDLPASASWSGAEVCKGDLKQIIQRLKQSTGNGQGKPILAIGGAQFMRALIATGEVDLFQLAIHPVILGSGLPIFNGLSSLKDLQLTHCEAFPGGIVIHTYKPL